MESPYIYIGHSSFGNPSITELTKIPDELAEFDRYMYVKIPDKFQIITLCNFNESTNTRTTRLLFGAMKNMIDFNQEITNLMNYSDSVSKTTNILVFSRVLVSNFLIWSLKSKPLSKLTIKSSLQSMFSIDLIEKIIESWELFTSSRKSEKAWTAQGFITKLHNFDFITGEIIDLVLHETKINISIYKPGDIIKWMNFD